jgi:HAD superfamily hydrolase (TIGR01549 family)
MYKAIFFDLDNTLYDYDSADKLATQALYEEFKKETDISFEKFESVYSDSKNEVKRKLVGTAASHERILYLQELVERVDNTFQSDRIMKLYHAYWDTLVENATLFDGVIETFEWLKNRNIKIVVVTNLTTYVQIRKLGNLGISKYIDYLVTSQEAGYDKPHPANFLLALHKSNLLAQDVLMIGDDLKSDIEGAQALNIKTVLYEFGKQKQSKVKPDYIVRNFQELLSLISSF